MKESTILVRALAGVLVVALIGGANASSAQAVGSTSPSATPSTIAPASSEPLTVSFTASTGGTTANWGADVVFETPAFTIPAPATYELVDTFNHLAVRGVSGSVITCNLGGTQVTFTSQLLATRVLAASYAACNRDVYAGSGVVVYGIYISMPSGSTFSISSPEQISVAIGAGGITAPSTERNYDYGAYTYETGAKFVILDEGYASIAVSQSAPTPSPTPGPSPVAPSTTEKVTLSLDTNGGTCDVDFLTGELGSWQALPSESECMKNGARLKAWQTKGAQTTFEPGAFVNLTAPNTLYAEWASEEITSDAQASGTTPSWSSPSRVIWKVGNGLSPTITVGDPTDLPTKKSVFTLVVKDSKIVTARAIAQTKALAVKFGGEYAGISEAASWKKPRIVAAYND